MRYVEASRGESLDAVVLGDHEGMRAVEAMKVGTGAVDSTQEAPEQVFWW